jgi:UDP-N-acetylmuramate: L-alanyl-gamma-D-glutamyl-meso-diaminopimelate ligase
MAIANTTIRKSVKRVYLCGIGGIGMANVAALLKQGGFEVSGSDANVYEPAASILREAGVKLLTPYGAENVPTDGTPVIVGNALSRGHMEVEAALDAGAPMFSFPEFLCRNVLAGRHTLVVAGTHGKSTMTACLAHILYATGRNPGFLVGAQPVNFSAGAAWGGEEGPFAIEGDEYDSAFFDKRSKFLHYFPRTLILGNVEYDHADIFPSLTDMLLSYQRLLRLLPQRGDLVFLRDSEATTTLAGAAPCRKTSVGLTEKADWMLLEGHRSLSFRAPDGRRHEQPFALPGRHNRLNALISVAAACVYSVPLEDALRAVGAFRGLRRRLEKLLERPDLIVYDDFAHHPTAIAETLRALREEHPKLRLVAVLEPRSNTMVRNVFRRELAEALTLADEVVAGTIHRADRIPATDRLDLDRLRSDLMQVGVRFTPLPNSEIPGHVRAVVQTAPSVVVFMSNGGFDGVPQRFVELLN